MNSARQDEGSEFNDNIEHALDSLGKVEIKEKDVLPTDSEIKRFSNELNNKNSYESKAEKLLSSSAMPKDLSNTFK